MAHWLVKSEPGSYGWDDLRRDGGTEWDGVRNNAAAAHLRAMQVGDRALFYHSGEEKAAVGIAAVARGAQGRGRGQLGVGRDRAGGTLTPRRDARVDEGGAGAGRHADAAPVAPVRIAG